MRAAVYRRFGGPDTVRVEEVPRPSVGPDDVLVRSKVDDLHRKRYDRCPFVVAEIGDAVQFAGERLGSVIR